MNSVRKQVEGSNMKKDEGKLMDYKEKVIMANMRG